MITVDEIKINNLKYADDIVSFVNSNEKLKCEYSLSCQQLTDKNSSFLKVT